MNIQIFLILFIVSNIETNNDYILRCSTPLNKIKIFGATLDSNDYDYNEIKNVMSIIYLLCDNKLSPCIIPYDMLHTSKKIPCEEKQKHIQILFKCFEEKYFSYVQ